MKYIVKLFIWLLSIKIKFKLIKNQFDLLKYIKFKNSKKKSPSFKDI